MNRSSIRTTPEASAVEGAAEQRGVATKATIRPAREHERRAVYTWLAQSDLTSAMMGPPLFPEVPVPTWQQFSDDYLPHFFDGSRPEIGMSYIIEADGRAVGHVSYSQVDRARNRAELDIWLCSEQVCGRGYGTDALAAVTRRLHQALGITEFIIRPSRRNPRAIRAYGKAGFTLLPLTRKQQTAQFGPGEYDDTVVMLLKCGHADAHIRRNVIDGSFFARY